MPTSILAYSFSPTQSGSFTINIPCISVGMTTVVYSISNYGAETAPSWISINSSTGVLTISSASIATNQVFSFYVNSVFNMPSSTVQTVVSLTSDCVIQNWLLSTSSTSNWIVCGTGYSLTSGNCGLSSATTGGSTSSNSGNSSSSASSIPFILKITLQSLFALTI